MQETFTEQEEETHHRHRRAAALRPLRRSPRGLPQSQIQNSPRRQERGREARGGREKERRKVQKRERKITEYDYWGVVIRSVEPSAVRVKSTRGKRRRREGRGLCGLRRRHRCGDGDGQRTELERDAVVPGLSLSLARPCCRPSVRPPPSRRRSQGRQAAAFRSNGKRDRSAETE
jgi:hypothetical protein